MIDPIGAVLASIALAMVVSIRLEWREYQQSRQARIKGLKHAR
jgi:hypothetical protein